MDSGAVLWSVDFLSPFAIGVPNLAQYDLGFSRASVANAQTGANNIASGFGVDTPRVGSDGTRQGLLIEEARTNIVLWSRDLSNAAWIGGTTLTAGQPRPDGGIGATLVQTDSGAVGRRQNPAIVAGTTTVSSAWLNSSLASQLVTGQSSTNGTNVPALSVWRRYVLPSFVDGQAAVGIYCADGRGGLFAGSVAGARADVVDFAQVEAGKFATEPISTGGSPATRAAERLFKNTGASLVDGGRLSLEFSLYPKGSSTQYSLNQALWSVDINNCTYILNGPNGLRTFVGGVAYDTPQAIAWNAGDRVDVWVAVGGGKPCDLQYRLNAGAPIKLSTGAPASLGNVAAGAMDLLNQATNFHWSSWIRYIQAYRNGFKPTWTL